MKWFLNKYAMAKFIGVTNFDNEKLIVNVNNILWLKPYNQMSSIIYLAALGKNEYPVSLVVKESQDTIMSYIISTPK